MRSPARHPAWHSPHSSAVQLPTSPGNLPTPQKTPIAPARLLLILPSAWGEGQMLTHGKGEKGGRAKREKVLSSISSTNHSSPYHEHPPGNCSICVCTTHSKTDKQTQKLLSWKFPIIYKKPSGIILPVSIAIKSCHILFHPSSLHIWGVGRAGMGGEPF